MRDDYLLFKERGAEIVCLAPHSLEKTRRFAAELALPFAVLADAERSVFREYDVQSRLWSLGQRPGLYVIDRLGVIRFAHVGIQQWDIPANAVVLDVLAGLSHHDPPFTS